jgi:mono/diheme cytochrome c family protein
MRVIFGLALLLPLAQVRSQQPAAGTVDYAREIQPILTKNCQSCHQGGAAPASLRLDSAAGLMEGSVSGKVIVSGKSGESLLVQRIAEASGLRMPLNGQPLSVEDIARIRTWIDQGARIPEALLTAAKAPAPKHWAYLKPVRPALPAVKDTGWSRNAIDRFVLARLEKEGLKPSPEASKETLIRRASLDLTGLPPSPAEIDAFLADTRADAYERLVDRLLASPHYGERWATPWLDLARYGDSEGWTNDRQRVAWPYRDWVIRALNRNLPFDQFTIEQLAGDMLPNATNDQKIATGFVRSSMLQSEGGTDPEENNWNAQIDRTNTVGITWLGSSLGCSQCHNHKYDPFTQKQYYQMVAFFNNSAFSDEKGDPRLVAAGVRFGFIEPRLDLATPEQAQKRDEINFELQKFEKQLNDSSPEVRKRQADWEQQILAYENQWQPLRPTRLVSTNGTTLTPAGDGSIVASGSNPKAETYVLEAKAPFQQITGIRIEALPDTSLPGGGPGRDYYGNFKLMDVKVEAGPSAQQLLKVALAPALTDDGTAILDVPRIPTKEIWIVDATHQVSGGGYGKESENEPRLRVQLLLIPQAPIKSDADGMLRVTIVQESESSSVNLGRFRVSVTTAVNPKMVLGIPAGIRPVLSIAAEKRTSEQADAVATHYRNVAPELAPVRQKIAELRDKIEALNIPKALILAENNKVPHPSAYIRMRGAFVSKGELVQADVPSFLGPLPAGATPNRLGLAKWLVSRDHPLTARVAVNHFWETIFGRGIVETTEEFGSQGFPPTHPELLDWLATEFMDSGWDMKAIKRLLVTSSTYRQSSAVAPALLERDPTNALLARGPRFRVDAEMVRDVALATSGLLSAKMFGSPVMPPQPDGLWDGFPGLRIGPDEWVVSPGEDRYRRGLYTFIRRSVRYPSLTVFDAPSREFCTARRNHSDTPLQALTTLNDPAFFEAAQAMARRILAEGGANDTARAVYGFRLATARRPLPQELDTLVSAFDKSRQHFEANLKEAEAASGKPDAELAAWTVFSNALLNLDEVLTKE